MGRVTTLCWKFCRGGDIEIGGAILDVVAQVKRANPRAVYCCDPVMGDFGRGLFMPEVVADFMLNRAVKAADVLTPNHFELERIARRDIQSVPSALSAMDTLCRSGPRVVLVTSFIAANTPADSIDLVVRDANGGHSLRTPKLPIVAHGAGDLIAALFLAYYLRSGLAVDALARSAASVFGILKRTADLGAKEMALIDAQDELIHPSATFRAEPL